MESTKTQTKYSFCRICESLCGLEIEMDGNEVVKIRPDSKHVATRGFACPKGLKQHKLFSTPDRLKYPMRKSNGKWERSSWDTVNKEIGAKVKQLVQDHGPDSIAMYVGTAAGFGVLHPIFAQGFMTGIGSKNMYASASQDCSNKFAIAQHMYGFPFTQPFPDIHHSECLIIVGANPVVSKWSFLQVPNPSKHLKEMEERGARIFVIDPRRNETAKVAGEHVFIRPNSDVYFFLSFLNELDILNGIDQSRVNSFMRNLDPVLELARKWPAERTEELTGISPDKLKEIVKVYSEADGASMYSSTGVNMNSNGTLAFWIQEVINAVSGNLDKKGGSLVGRGVIDFPKFGKKNGTLLRKDKSRIGNFNSVNDTFPGGILADEILTNGDKQIKALFVTGGNPLITMANSNRLREAFSKLELLVTLDIQPSETAMVGNYMLPCTSPLERPDLPFIFPLMLGLQVKPYLQATKRIVKPEGEQRDEATIYLDICKHSGYPIFGSSIAQRFFQMGKRKRNGDSQPSVAQEFLLSMLLRLTRQGSFRKLLKQKHGSLRDGHIENDFLGKRVLTEDGLVDLSPQVLMDAAKKLESDFQRELSNKNKLKLISKRAVTTHNSWTHNIEEFTSGDRYTNYLYMHPKDMEERGLKKKDLVDITSETASVRVHVWDLPDLMPGTVALPHGWGHQASGLDNAKKTLGVNVNILSADGPDKIDKVSGMAHLTGIPVVVKKADGKLAKSWSGLQKDVWEK